MSGCILGVDPGKYGALAILDTAGELVVVEDMPAATGAALGAHIRELLEDWQPFSIDAAWVEKVGAMPKQGLASTWKFAEGYGAILGALGALSVPVHHVRPSVWKAAQRVTADKSACRQRATELWPSSAGLFARVKDADRAEAALIARYGKMSDG